MNGFRPIRRSDRDLGEDAAREILLNGYGCTLCVPGAEGYPYGVPMNYVMEGDRLLFHCSKAGGLLLESVGSGCRACVTVTERMEGVRSRSAIAFGTIREEPAMLPSVLKGIVDKYVPEPGRESAMRGIAHASQSATALVFEIEHISAKMVDKPEGRRSRR